MISGTPRAGGGKPNRMPRRVRDFRLFAQAIASRYSGRFRGLSLRALLVGVERARSQPLSDATVRQEGPLGRTRELRQAVRSRVCGDQSRQPLRQGRDRRDVGAGRDRRKPMVSDTHSPGRFAELSRRRTRGSGSTPGLTTHIRSTRTRSRDRRSGGRTSPSRPFARFVGGSSTAQRASGLPTTATRRSPRTSSASPTRRRLGTFAPRSR